MGFTISGSSYKYSVSDVKINNVNMMDMAEFCKQGVYDCSYNLTTFVCGFGKMDG